MRGRSFQEREKDAQRAAHLAGGLPLPESGNDVPVITDLS